MRRIRRLSVIGLVVVLLLGGRLMAQDTGDVFLMLHEQQLYRWTQANGLQAIGELLPQTEFITMSPIGTYFVYRVLTERAVKTIQEECPCGGGDFPSNIWAVDMSTGSRELIAGQPPEATETVLETTRSNPVWSPDGSKMAWIEGVEGQDLVIYDFATRQTSKYPKHDEFPVQGLASTTPALNGWTRTGILMTGQDYDTELNPTQTRYTFFNPDGSVVVNVTSQYLYPRWFWVTAENGGETILFRDRYNYSTINLATGAINPISGANMMTYVASQPETSLRMGTPTIDEQGLTHRDIYNPDGSLLTGLTSSSGFFTFMGPRTIQYDVQGTTQYIWRPEGSFQIELPWQPLVMFWRPSAMEMQQGGTQVIIQARCDGSNLPFRLYDDPNGYVLGNTANNLRSAPGSDSELVTQIPAGEMFTVNGFPQCKDGIAWWRVVYNEMQGWTAEGEGDEYWVAPGCSVDGCAQG